MKCDVTASKEVKIKIKSSSICAYATTFELLQFNILNHKTPKHINQGGSKFYK